MDANTFSQVELFKREIAELTQEKYWLIKRVKELSEERDELLLKKELANSLPDQSEFYKPYK
jgi:hypothetical protein